MSPSLWKPFVVDVTRPTFCLNLPDDGYRKRVDNLFLLPSPSKGGEVAEAQLCVRPGRGVPAPTVPFTWTPVWSGGGGRCGCVTHESLTYCDRPRARVQVPSLWSAPLSHVRKPACNSRPWEKSPQTASWLVVAESPGWRWSCAQRWLRLKLLVHPH